ncbi:MAG: hypothetical protein LBJ46_10505 [Planctomycetota bacterium]|jgi:hypothetical protein|nr:hypothetical protein [Planctomycetota bacterium]
MNPLPSRSDGRSSWKSLAVFAGLLLVGALSVINYVELTRLSAAAPSEDARLQVLAARLAELAQEVEAVQKPADAVPLARFTAERESVERRLAAIEQAINERLSDDGLQGVRERLAQLEEDRAQQAANPPVMPAPPANPLPAPPVPPPPPRLAEPAFRVIGIERRAEERFLTILPARARSLAQARLLRVGDAEGGWRLDAIEDDAGVFSQGGRKRRMNLTGGQK